MSQRKIVIEPDPILREKSAPLEKVDDELRSLLDDMLETMYAAPGIGLAAVQVGYQNGTRFSRSGTSRQPHLRLICHQR